MADVMQAAMEHPADPVFGTRRCMICGRNVVLVRTATGTDYGHEESADGR